jgi:ATP-binding cassette subfamily F protein uup
VVKGTTNIPLSILNLLSAENLNKSYNERVLFNQLTIGLNQGDKVALIGSNGAGKSTLMRILAGGEPADNGVVSIRKGIKVCYLSQAPTFGDGVTVGQAIFDNAGPVAQAVVAYEKALLDAERTDLDAEVTSNALSAALEKLDELQGWDFETRAHEVLGRLHIHDLDALCDELSGGQRKRVALAQMVLSEPDLVLLDEPTNHLDLQAIEWLENYLSTAATTMLLVTHDRYFLDRVCNTVMELENQQLYSYKGNYAYFLEKKSEREQILASEVAKAKNLYTKELDWIRRQPKARGTKARYRVEAFEDVKSKAHTNLKKDSLMLDVKTSRQGNKILEIEKASIALGGNVLLDKFSYVFKKGDRIGIIGPNGVGKSTFLNLITGRLQPDSGTMDPGQTTKMGYYRQEDDTLNPENRLIDEVRLIAEYISLSNGEQITISKLLERFLFAPKTQYSLIGKLSGGERRRVQLLKILAAAPNFLILDEPTNDLDIDTLNVLEDFLEGYGGTLVVVSHDRYFMDRLVDHLFVFEGNGQIRDFGGNYTDYRTWLSDGGAEQDEKSDAKPAAKTNAKSSAKDNMVSVPQQPKPTATNTSTAKRKLSYKEQQELQQLDEKIPALEAEKVRITNQMNSGDMPHNELAAAAKTLEQIAEQLDELGMRWLELSE